MCRSPSDLHHLILSSAYEPLTLVGLSLDIVVALAVRYAKRPWRRAPADLSGLPLLGNAFIVVTTLTKFTGRARMGTTVPCAVQVITEISTNMAIPESLPSVKVSSDSDAFTDSDLAFDRTKLPSRPAPGVSMTDVLDRLKSTFFSFTLARRSWLAVT